MAKNGSKGIMRRIRCAKGRDYVDSRDPNVHKSKKRKSSTQKTFCPFKLTAKPLPDGQWLLGLPAGVTGEHNHGWMDSSSFAANRGHTLQPHMEVIRLANNSVRPRQILTVIHTEQLGVIRSDIRNLL